MQVMALPMARPERVEVRLVAPRRSFRPSTLGRVPHLGAAVEAIGRGLAVGIGLGILVIAGPGAASLTTIGLLAIGAALVSWSE
jgi:hypothetical protein